MIRNNGQLHIAIIKTKTQQQNKQSKLQITQSNIVLSKKTKKQKKQKNFKICSVIVNTKKNKTYNMLKFNTFQLIVLAMIQKHKTSHHTKTC